MLVEGSVEKTKVIGQETRLSESQGPTNYEPQPERGLPAGALFL